MRADNLKGTNKRDVICGRGGNDRIDGRGGDDIIESGTGNDAVLGGSGNDVIVGGDGNDVLDGSTGNDTVRAGAGDDRAIGEAGDDQVFGDDGRDVVSGGTGDDAIFGDGGDDELSGDAGGDDVDGGEGANVCDLPDSAGDTQIRCLVDTEAPVVHEAMAAPTSVDVTDGEKIVEVRVRVTDDTGVKQVQVGRTANLVSGTARDGIWALSVRVPRYVDPGSRTLHVFATDRVGRMSSQDIKDVYTVSNDAVDRTTPQVVSFELSRNSVDVRTTAQSIAVVARITDDLAGPRSVKLCPSRPADGYYQSAGECTPMGRISGTALDGTYKAVHVIPQGSTSGTWIFEIEITDDSGNYELETWGGSGKDLPDGATGWVEVQGADPDRIPPQLTSLQLSPPRVDSSRGATTVTADITATDVEGLKAVYLGISGYAGYPGPHSWRDTVYFDINHNFKLVSGTPQQGVWRSTFVVPGGTPKGEYFISVMIKDDHHARSWSTNTGSGRSEPLTPKLSPGGIYFIVDNSSDAR